MKRTTPEMAKKLGGGIKSTAEQEAVAAYELAAANVAALLLQLQSKLEKHRSDFVASGSTNWGYPGDLNHFADVLAGIVGQTEKEKAPEEIVRTAPGFQKRRSAVAVR